ncbi:GMC oxidoreductase [Sphaerobolus stellatus SS14]|uniref:GMC oxidoreductase n=1 Tax=Sphaerobolus stellatus (strain SS14) TaxID=990650 RepID=A0A0C9TXP1_SPHS4|nr:GMC oxidoreductase [Sphaerobolus stellatus SS14]
MNGVIAVTTIVTAFTSIATGSVSSSIAVGTTFSSIASGTTSVPLLFEPLQSLVLLRPLQVLALFHHRWVYGILCLSPEDLFKSRMSIHSQSRKSASTISDLVMQSGAARTARKIFQPFPLSNIIKPESVPGFDKVPNSPDGCSDEAWASWIQSTFDSVSHPIGTAAMMRRSLGGVVDGRLRVYGTSGLRVIDASIIPFQIGGHLQSTVYGIAEKAADIIKSGV